MYNLTSIEFEFWKKFSKRYAVPVDAEVSASIVGNDSIANSLLQLYLDGKKTAASGLVRDYEVAGDPLPSVGSFWIILDVDRNPRCIVKTIRVETHIFDQVPEYVATAEGEGDGSIQYWREAHRRFFEPYLKKLNIQDLSKERIVVEFFEVLAKDL